MTEGHSKYINIIWVVLSILLVIIPAILAYGELTQKVENIEEDNIENTERVNNLDARIIELEKIAAGTEVSLQTIQRDIGEIKLDLKEISQDLKINPEGK